MFPVAVSCELEFTVVETALPFNRTSAPFTNLLPLTVNEKFPVFVDVGLIPLITGIGFIRVTALVPVAEESAALVALTVTVLGLGKVAGATYFPFASIVPSALEPPLVPFTDQVTLEFDVPLTVA